MVEKIYPYPKIYPSLLMFQSSRLVGQKDLGFKKSMDGHPEKTTTSPLKGSIYLIAGETSGDFLGAHLIKALKEKNPHLTFQGIGGPLMIEQNFSSLFPLQDLSVMGLAEILPHLPHLFRRIEQTVQDILDNQPAVLVTIDSPGFCHRVAKAVKKTDPTIKIVHYVAPSVWAWRPGRAKKLAKWVDHLITLFPFELPYFLPYGLQTTFVGHPLLEQPIQPDPTFRPHYQIPETAPVLTLLAGSRQGEIDRLLPVFCQTAKILSHDFPGLHILSPTLPLYESLIRKALSSEKLPHTVVTSPSDKYAAFYSSDVALAASGTVSLELALTKVPMVIGYKLSPLTYFLAKHLVNIKNVCLINILLKEQIVPEFLQGDCNPHLMAQALRKLLTTKGESQKNALEQTVKLLENPAGIPPSEKAAQVILGLL